MINALAVMLVLGCTMGLILYLASTAFHVEVDERLEKTTAMLPGYNCGSCGYPGCSGLASALINKETDTVNCRPCKKEQRDAIVEYLNNTPDAEGNTLKVKSI